MEEAPCNVVHEMLPEKHVLKSKKVYWMTPNQKEPCFEGIGWNGLGLHPNEMMEVVEDREK